MRHSIEVGLSFGLTSAVITTLGLMVGLSGTSPRLVLGGILLIAIADSASDALGIHISEESENRHSAREIWESTAATFFAKFLVALTFVVPVLFLELAIAVRVNIAWGLLLLTAVSYYLARREGQHPGGVIAEHLVIAVLVVIVSRTLGLWVAAL
ncbi:hypothetical protein J4439_04690 [Candidatus Woesearchaeota archaeon]|nr:hypothetical protein [Candidatus Woesearchaeota archaeon]